jgi:hypothetical protein
VTSRVHVVFVFEAPLFNSCCSNNIRFIVVKVPEMQKTMPRNGLEELLAFFLAGGIATGGAATRFFPCFRPSEVKDDDVEVEVDVEEEALAETAKYPFFFFSFSFFRANSNYMVTRKSKKITTTKPKRGQSFGASKKKREEEPLTAASLLSWAPLPLVLGFAPHLPNSTW